MQTTPSRNGSSDGRGWRSVAHAAWTQLPAWLLFFGALGFLHTAVAVLDPSRFRAVGHTAFDFAVTALLPSAWIALLFMLRARKRDIGDHRRRTPWLVPALLLAPLVVDFALFTIVPSLRTPVSDRELLLQFEWMNLFWVAALALHAWRTRGLHAVATFFGIGLLYGAVLENTGILLGFFSEHNYTLYLWRLPAPVATIVGWSTIVYTCVWMTEQIREQLPWFKRTPLGSALLTVGIALASDVQFDPLASLSGLAWQWNSLLPTWFLTVPFCNFAAWFGAVMPFAWAYFAIGARTDLTDRQRNWELLARIPAIAGTGGLIWLAIMTAYEGGLSGPTYRILADFFASMLSPGH